MEQNESTDNVQPKAVEEPTAANKPFERKVKKLKVITANVSLRRFEKLLDIVEMLFNAVNNQNPLYRGDEILAEIERLKKGIDKFKKNVEKD